jgi:hypothetical protein
MDYPCSPGASGSGASAPTATAFHRRRPTPDLACSLGTTASPPRSQPPTPTSSFATTLLGEFVDPRVEADFWAATAPAFVKTDTLTFVIAVAVFVAAARRQPPPHPLPALATIWTCMSLLWTTAPAFAVRHRLAVMPVCRVALVGLPMVFVHLRANPMTWAARTPADWNTTSMLTFVLKTPRVHGLLMGGAFMCPPFKRHTVTSAVCAALVLITAPSAAAIRERYFGVAAHVRFADSMSSITRVLGLHSGTRPPRIPPHRAALAFILESQLFFGVFASAVVHAVVVASLRRRYARARGAQVNEIAAAIDGVLIAAAAVAGIVCFSWWLIEISLGEWR